MPQDAIATSRITAYLSTIIVIGKIEKFTMHEAATDQLGLTK